MSARIFKKVTNNVLRKDRIYHSQFWSCVSRYMCTNGEDVFNSKTNKVTSKDSNVRKSQSPKYSHESELHPEHGTGAGNALKGIIIGKGNESDSTFVPKQSDIAIIGGGLVGSAAAFWIRKQSRKGLSVTVIERDSSYAQASSMLSVGGVRHQFSIPENVLMSMFTTDFIRNISQHLGILGQESPDVQFHHQGYLFLASEQSAETLSKGVAMQRELGANIELLTKSRLAQKYPWLNLDGIECASQGIQGEGWFDPWLLLSALKKKNISLGVNYVNAEVEGFFLSDRQNDIDMGRLSGLQIKRSDGTSDSMEFAMCINCAGAWAGEVAKLAGIGTGTGPLSVGLPVEPRKRFVYVTHCPEGPGLECPLVVDTSGMYFRPEGLGGHFLLGGSPYEDKEPDASNLEVDYNFFEEEVWPPLAHRVPSFEKLKVKSAWAGYYDHNTFDQNLVIGPHPIHRNFYFANGMSGHGVQHALCIGHALMELILYDEYKFIDLDLFKFERTEPVLELGIV
ncbi:FAD-dependent oxidoreductase domain-containing protein 1-like [Ylistrum balloti]|uniref:FAD-dependent oxidoreductase domain-containing protein 1-like n=1 Tax=Ylistrum balloti TaxID=509963 RepID=UPI002905CC94|nr:FAD-dependent oxidoreductase domain-containing protein 1-like [Ylistrum balloti]